MILKALVNCSLYYCFWMIEGILLKVCGNVPLCEGSKTYCFIFRLSRQRTLKAHGRGFLSVQRIYVTNCNHWVTLQNYAHNLGLFLGCWGIAGLYSFYLVFSFFFNVYLLWNVALGLWLVGSINISYVYLLLEIFVLALTSTCLSSWIV